MANVDGRDICAHMNRYVKERNNSTVLIDQATML